MAVPVEVRVLAKFEQRGPGRRGGCLMCGCGGCIETCPSCKEEETCLDCHTCPPDDEFDEFVAP